MLKSIDLWAVGLYLGSLVAVGVVARRRAAASKDAYLLGGKALPWYLLGLSNASGMFDISGTMWMVTLAFVYGMKSVWIPWLWPCFNQIFLMVFMAAWLRRSGCTTGAEWITFRFGAGRGATLAHTVIVVFALVNCLGFLAYGFVGLGKFIQIFVPWSEVAPFVPLHVPDAYVPHVYGIAFTLFSVFYSILGGMASIVWADVIQYLIMAVASVIIAVIAMVALSGQSLPVPDGWMSPFFGWHLNLDWSRVIPEVNDKIREDGFSVFGAFFMMMVFKGILSSLAGPAPSYDMQKILSTRSPKEAALMSGVVSIILLPVRYLMIGGFAVLGLLYYERLNLSAAGRIDFEQILPSAISQFVPAGLTGVLLAGLLAAFIGTFAGTLNAAQAYLVNDLYLKYVNPGASSRQVARISYATGVAVVVVSIVCGVFAKDVNSVLQWIVSGLFGSYLAANLLKWFWWRFNGCGYFWGMVAGLVPAMIFPRVFHFLDLYYFPLIALISLAGCVAGTYAAPPTDDATLRRFYARTRPWGFWAPVHRAVVAADPAFVNRSSFARDMANTAVGVVAQTCLMIIPLYLVLLRPAPALAALLILVVSGAFLKRYWWRACRADFERE
jgi:Na+/proline symporter